MKKYIHDGLGLRVMRGQENKLGQGQEVFIDKPCDLLEHRCRWRDEGDDEELPPDWAPSLGGYSHPGGAEVQRRGERWAWFRRGEDVCPPSSYKRTREEAMLCACPRWTKVSDWCGQPVFMKGPGLVYCDGELWKHNHSREAFYLSPEAAMLAAEKWLP